MSSASDPQTGAKIEKAKVFFKTGNDAALKSNYDYAIQMYQEACKLHPDNLVYRQMLRGTERRKFGNEPSKVGRLVSARTQPIRMRARSAKGKGQWAHAIEICEEAFAHNPWDVGAARDAAEAAEQGGLKELAQWLLESVQLQANDADFFRYLAHVHELNASWPKAIAALERVKKINPNDEDVNRQINALSASATIMRSGLGESLNKRPGDADAEAASTPGLDELKQPKLSPEERFQKEIQENPTQIGPYLHMADHYKKLDKLDEAEKVLARGIKAVPDDPTLKSEHAAVQIARIQRALKGWSKKSQDRPDDPAPRAKVEQLQTMLLDYETEEFRRKIALQPGDPQLHYELGLRLAQAGKHKDAIGAFQQARNSNALKVKALHQLGLSFEAEGVLPLAQRNYLDALKAAEREDVTTTNALHYRLGRVAEALGNTKDAEEHYNEVAANDYGYLDVAQRLRGLS